MKINLVTNIYAPDQLAGAALYEDLALFLKSRGHDVRVTTTFSYYPAWKLRPEDEGRLVRNEISNSIFVRRIKIFVPRKPTGFKRILSDFSFFISLAFFGRFKSWKSDVVVTALPMLSQCLWQRFSNFGSSRKCLIIVQDFAVEAALELKIVKIPFVNPLLSFVQRWALRSAKTLSTISPLMLQKLTKVVGSDRRLVMIPNWIHQSMQEKANLKRQNAKKRKFGQLFYSGNLGIKQGLPEIIAVLSRLPEFESSWKLKIHGEGADADRVRETNSRPDLFDLGPLLAEDDYIEELLSTSACLITQKAGVGFNFLPSKLLPALACGTPVLAICDKTSPLGMEVLAGGFGEVVEPNDTQALAELLVRWHQNPDQLEHYSSKALERAKIYQREYILEQYLSEIENLRG